MSNETRGTEWKVGLFIAVGLAVIAIMAVSFGKLGTGLKKSYEIRVEFPDASGLLKGGEVRLAGAKVGFTSASPELVEGRFAVVVPLRIRDGVKIPKNAVFTVASAGLMGDSYVAITLPAEPSDEFLENGALIVGTRVKGLSDLTADGAAMIEELTKRLQELEAPIKDVRDRLLSDVNLGNLQQSFANIREFTDSLKKSGKELDEVLQKAKGAGDDLNAAMATAKDAMGKVDAVVSKVDAAATELRPTIAGLRTTFESIDKTVASVRVLINRANQGQGALGLLLTDREMAENLKAFVRNIKARGILWYKDKP